ncbi:aminotransferase class III-fold pyridoxal phosphate-dependent enzyme [Nodularia sp. NIES-3585]|uniref:aminotransferase class III-fold pyridoxal phosphate-dependent enzyme n=1 Tax=Nodularia sp. NIES-3585 TaxID=1973477 RepID=UPI000B5CA951|nr:aminotransferase class III-fold pyridoxal phosphate-dependent enzyme [Nodularia sp. NIES-3585]GAX38794.1 amino acid adenylation domain-containing protein [Nodularia sp. NIES-3585]
METSQKAKDIKQEQPEIERSLHLLTLSAKSDQALSDMAARYQAFLGDEPTESLADICFSANTRRSHFEHRLAIFTESTVQLQRTLDTFIAGKKAAKLLSGQSPKNQRPPLAFLFTGQGSQYIGMGRQLYEEAPTFRKTLDLANEILRPELPKPLLEVLYPSTEESSLLNETVYTQPALFALEYALTELWRSWGIKPSVVMGHSVGEYVAACVAGAFNLEEGLKLIAKRASLMQALPEQGEMVVVFADEVVVQSVIQPYLQDISIAAINGPRNIVISGVSRAIEAVVAILATEGVETRRLRVSHAFHSPVVEQMLDAFEQQAKQIQFKALQIPLISNLNGEIMLPGQVLDASYWLRQTRETVKFTTGMNTLFEEGYELFLEIGPKAILSSLGKRCQPEETATWLSSLTQVKDDWHSLLLSLSALYVRGADINWMGFDEGYLRKVLSLPTYPFQRKSYWFENFSMNENKFTDKQDNYKNNTLSEQENKFAVTTPSTEKQRDTIVFQLRSLVANLLKAEPDDVGLYASFLEMGADSIALMDAVRAIESTYGFKISIRQFFEELPNIDALATYIYQNLSPELSIADSPEVESEPELKVQQQTQPNRPFTVAKPPIFSRQDGEKGEITSETGLERIMRQQLEVISQSMSQVVSQQLEFLQKNGFSTNNLLSSKNGKAPSSSQTKTPIVPVTENNQQKDVITSYLNSQIQVKSQAISEKASLHSANLIEGLSQQQQQHLEALIALYNQRTQKSKERSQTYRPVIADSRAVAGFRLSTKEMVYPIIGERGQGSKFWDIDGNEYVDITMGFGVLLFGHAPSFITKAVQEQMEMGLQIGPQSNLAGEVAQLICELTSMERVTFCNSGTEAVMTALRLARTATGRSKIALFAGSYHGHFDGVLATALNGQMTGVPMALGVSQHIVQDVLVLDYGNPESLKILQACGHELAAVLVEPVQSRQPHLQPKEFLLQLRQLTEAAGCALIFDEVLTGFRIDPNGAQAWFGIQADIATYGKILGGGMPIGVVAGKATYMNGIDGGLWNYGDASYPQTEKTFFAGTFNKNHLGMAAALSVLKYIKTQGATLQQQLNQRTSELAATLNAYFDQENVPIQIIYFGSLFRFTFSGNLDLLFYHLLVKGVYIWEGRNCFLSTAHTDEDIDYLIQAVKDSVEELRSGGFLPK